MSQRPVVDIEFRGWSPYAKTRPAATPPSASAPTHGAVPRTVLPAGGSIRRSSSPIFVSANKVASSSTSLQNGLPNGLSGGAGSKGHHGTYRNTPVKNGIVAAKTTTPLVVVSQPYSNGIVIASNAVAEPAYTKHRRQQGHEDVLPPADEPRLRSIFDDEDQCVWSPSHRIAKVSGREIRLCCVLFHSPKCNL